MILCYLSYRNLEILLHLSLTTILAAHRCSCGIELDLAGNSDVIRVDVHQQNMMI